VARFEIYTATNWNLSHFELLETGISRPDPILCSFSAVAGGRGRLKKVTALLLRGIYEERLS